MLQQFMNNLMKLWIDAAEGFPSPWPSTNCCAKVRLGPVQNISIALTLCGCCCVCWFSQTASAAVLRQFQLNNPVSSVQMSDAVPS